MNRSVLFLMAASLTAQVSFAAKPSSDIPDKREFPLSKTVNACENFEAYVCDNVNASFKLRPDRSSHTFSFNDSAERLLNIKKKYMADLPTAKNLNERTEQLRDFYMSCMDKKARTNSEKSMAKREVKAMQDIDSVDGLVTYLNQEQTKGMSASLARMWSRNDPDDSSKFNIAMFGNLMGLPDQKYYDQPEVVADYQKLLTAFFKNIDPKGKDGKPEARAKALVELEKDFAKIFPTPAARRQRISERHLSTQDEAVKKYPNLKLEMLFKKAPKTALVFNPFYEGSDFMNAELPKRPLSVWKDLALKQNVYPIMDDAYPKFYEQRFAFNKKHFGGPEKRAERQERCTEEVMSNFDKELDAALIDQVFPNFDEAKVQALADKIRASILEGLDDNKWLSSSARKEAIKKIKTARLQLVKPHNDKEWDFLPIRHYTKTDMMVNERLLGESQYSKMLHEMKEPANRDAWDMGPLTVNAYYSPPDNKFVLPIGILQYPFYDKDGSQIENLGAVGAVIGHELGHGIDDQGSKYDDKGALKPWMSEKDLTSFEQRNSRLVDQFNKIGHDGKLTLGENTADLVGLTFAYNAAFPDGKGSIEDKQQFFVGYGRLWCTVIRPDYAKLLLKTDPHSAGIARINEQVKQQPGFAEAFQCKAGDKMTLPESERVKIW
ncbi:M13 family metallopeptidase [Bdellovibrio sp. GT3]|uniref:M13 family metallopeptidase n=1 Tax=Bdellovibrio sp. GT3 TaxID=3136282 RepID=UPI0030EFC0A6